jgi:hypothetical protein
VAELLSNVDQLDDWCCHSISLWRMSRHPPVSSVTTSELRS